MLFVALGLACGGDDDDDTPTDSGDPTNIPGDNRESPSGPPGTVGALPLTFPEDFPQYAGVEPLRGADFGDRFTADWRAPDAAEVVIQFYIDVLSTPPWETTELENEDTDTATIDFTNDELGYFGEIAFGAIPGGGTRILLNLNIED